MSMLQVFRLYPLAGGGALKYLTQKWCVEKVKSPRRSLELLKFVKYSDYSLGCHMNEGRVREDVPGKHQKGFHVLSKIFGRFRAGKSGVLEIRYKKLEANFASSVLLFFGGSHCSGVRRLWLHNNRLTTLPESIGDLRHLMPFGGKFDLRHFSPANRDPPKKTQNWITEKTWVDLNFPVKFN